MGIDVFRHVSCPEEKLIENLEVGDNTGNNFDAIYLGFFMNGFRRGLMFRNQCDVIQRKRNWSTDSAWAIKPKITARCSISVISEQISMGFDVPSSLSRHLIEHDVMWCGRPKPDCSERL
jgi:hypothetical protein